MCLTLRAWEFARAGGFVREAILLALIVSCVVPRPARPGSLIVRRGEGYSFSCWLSDLLLVSRDFVLLVLSLLVLSLLGC